MAGIGDHHELALGQRLMQFPRTSRRANNVIAALNDNGWNGLNDVYMVENVGLFDKDGVDEVVAFNTGESDSEIQVFGFVKVFRIGEQATRGHFPTRPFLGCCSPDLDVLAGQAGIVRLDEISLLLFGDVVSVRCKSIREDVARSILIEPMKFRGAAHEDTTEHQTQHTLWMMLCVDQRKRRAPRTSEDVPFIDSKMLP